MEWAVGQQAFRCTFRRVMGSPSTKLIVSTRRVVSLGMLRGTSTSLMPACTCNVSPHSLWMAISSQAALKHESNARNRNSCPNSACKTVHCIAVDRTLHSNVHGQMRDSEMCTCRLLPTSFMTSASCLKSNSILICFASSSTGDTKSNFSSFCKEHSNLNFSPLHVYMVAIQME
jgi:hypothetical protein